MAAFFIPVALICGCGTTDKAILGDPDDRRQTQRISANVHFSLCPVHLTGDQFCLVEVEVDLFGHDRVD